MVRHAAPAAENVFSAFCIAASFCCRGVFRRQRANIVGLDCPHNSNTAVQKYQCLNFTKPVATTKPVPMTGTVHLQVEICANSELLTTFQGQTVSDRPSMQGTKFSVPKPALEKLATTAVRFSGTAHISGRSMANVNQPGADTSAPVIFSQSGPLQPNAISEVTNLSMPLSPQQKLNAHELGNTNVFVFMRAGRIRAMPVDKTVGIFSSETWALAMPFCATTFAPNLFVLGVVAHNLYHSNALATLQVLKLATKDPKISQETTAKLSNESAAAALDATVCLVNQNIVFEIPMTRPHPVAGDDLVTKWPPSVRITVPQSTAELLHTVAQQSSAVTAATVPPVGQNLLGQIITNNIVIAATMQDSETQVINQTYVPMIHKMLQYAGGNKILGSNALPKEMQPFIRQPKGNVKEDCLSKFSSKVVIPQMPYCGTMGDMNVLLGGVQEIEGVTDENDDKDGIIRRLTATYNTAPQLRESTPRTRSDVVKMYTNAVNQHRRTAREYVKSLENDPRNRKKDVWMGRPASWGSVTMATKAHVSRDSSTQVSQPTMTWEGVKILSLQEKDGGPSGLVYSSDTVLTVTSTPGTIVPGASMDNHISATVKEAMVESPTGSLKVKRALQPQTVPLVPGHINGTETNTGDCEDASSKQGRMRERLITKTVMQDGIPQVVPRPIACQDSTSDEFHDLNFRDCVTYVNQLLVPASALTVVQGAKVGDNNQPPGLHACTVVQDRAEIYKELREKLSDATTASGLEQQVAAATTDAGLQLQVDAPGAQTVTDVLNESSVQPVNLERYIESLHPLYLQRHIAEHMLYELGQRELNAAPHGNRILDGTGKIVVAVEDEATGAAMERMTHLSASLSKACVAVRESTNETNKALYGTQPGDSIKLPCSFVIESLGGSSWMSPGPQTAATSKISSDQTKGYRNDEVTHESDFYKELLQRPVPIEGTNLRVASAWLCSQEEVTHRLGQGTFETQPTMSPSDLETTMKVDFYLITQDEDTGGPKIVRGVPTPFFRNPYMAAQQTNNIECTLPLHKQAKLALGATSRVSYQFREQCHNRILSTVPHVSSEALQRKPYPLQLSARWQQFCEKNAPTSRQQNSLNNKIVKYYSFPRDVVQGASRVAELLQQELDLVNAEGTKMEVVFFEFTQSQEKPVDSEGQLHLGLAIDTAYWNNEDARKKVLASLKEIADKTSIHKKSDLVIETSDTATITRSGRPLATQKMHLSHGPAEGFSAAMHNQVRSGVLPNTALLATPCVVRAQETHDDIAQQKLDAVDTEPTHSKTSATVLSVSIEGMQLHEPPDIRILFQDGSERSTVPENLEAIDDKMNSEFQVGDSVWYLGEIHAGWEPEPEPQPPSPPPQPDKVTNVQPTQNKPRPSFEFTPKLELQWSEDENEDPVQDWCDLEEPQHALQVSGTVDSNTCTKQTVDCNTCTKPTKSLKQITVGETFDAQGVVYTTSQPLADTLTYFKENDPYGAVTMSDLQPEIADSDGILEELEAAVVQTLQHDGRKAVHQVFDVSGRTEDPIVSLGTIAVRVLMATGDAAGLFGTTQ